MQADMEAHDNIIYIYIYEGMLGKSTMVATIGLAMSTAIEATSTGGEDKAEDVSGADLERHGLGGLVSDRLPIGQNQGISGSRICKMRSLDFHGNQGMYPRRQQIKGSHLPESGR